MVIIMAKKSSTIYLEQKFWDIISEYQLSNHIDSRNDAIQLILHEWYILNSINHIEHKQSKSNDMSIIKIKDNINNEDKNIDPRITKGFAQISSSMKRD